MPAFKYSRTDQPQGMVGFDPRWTHIWCPSLGPHDLAGKCDISNAATHPTEAGQALYYAGVKPTIPYTTFPAEFTFLAKFRRPSSGPIVIGPSAPAYSSGGYFLVYDTASYYTARVGSNYSSCVAPATPGQWVTVVLRHTAGLPPVLFINGKKYTFAAAVAGYIDAAVYFDSSATAAGGDNVLTAITPERLSDNEAYALCSNPWQIVKPQSRQLWTLGTVSAGGGLSITTTLGDASASGYAATVNLQSNIAATQAIAAAIGSPATVNRQLAFATALATAAASGQTATVNLQRAVAATQAGATATGYAANVQFGNDISISATQAITTASGFDAAINLRLTVAATLATTTASGFDASISNGASIAASYGLASADGYQAQVNLQRDLAVTQALATAFGALATIRFGGAGTYPTAEEIVAALLAHPQFLTLTKFLALKDI